MSSVVVKLAISIFFLIIYIFGKGEQSLDKTIYLGSLILHTIMF